MRIIKEGKIELKEHEEVCYKCNAEFAYTQADTKRDRDGAYVECPCCKAFVSSKFN